jgi:hypothetical protein
LWVLIVKAFGLFYPIFVFVLSPARLAAAEFFVPASFFA